MYVCFHYWIILILIAITKIHNIKTKCICLSLFNLSCLASVAFIFAVLISSIIETYIATLYFYLKIIILGSSLGDLGYLTALLTSYSHKIEEARTMYGSWASRREDGIEQNFWECLHSLFIYRRPEKDRKIPNM